MTFSRLLLRGLAHAWRWHLGLLLGVALAAAVIAGSLMTGDSVRETLRVQAAQRLGQVKTVVLSRDGFFTEALAEKLESSHMDLRPMLLQQATVVAQGGSRRVNAVNLYGVRDGYPIGRWQGTAMNRTLANALEAGTGSTLIIRFEKPGLISRDAPLSGESDQTTSLREQVTAIMENDVFSLNSNTVSPLNLYVPLATLQAAAGLPGQVNLVLARIDVGGDPGWDEAEHTAYIFGAVQQNLAAHFTLPDLQITHKETPGAEAVATSRIFLPDAVAAKVQAAFPQARGVLTYLVNEIIGPASAVTPYSMVSAVTPGDGGIPADLPQGSVLIHPWLAEDQGLKAGDKLRLKYYAVTRARQIEEREAEFSIHAVLAGDSPALRRDWTPDFPGVSESENCRDWKPGIPIRQDIIRDKDDAYWKEHRGTPKVFLHLADGQKLWNNRFGQLTALRIPRADYDVQKLRNAITPADAGIQVVNVAALSDQAVAQSMNFGALFIGMSGFLILAALLLAVLLFVFGIEQRATQAGLLRAQGWTAGKVRSLFFREALLVCVPAALLGTLAGIGWTHWTLGRLEGDWQGAALGLQFVRRLSPLSMGIACGTTVLLSLLAVRWATRRLLRATPRALLSGDWQSKGKEARPSAQSAWRRWLWPAVCLVLAGAGLASSGKVPPMYVPMCFFGAAFFLLFAGLLLLRMRLVRMEAESTAMPASLWTLGVRNTSRRRGRSIALAAMLASGVFLITALHAFRQDARLMENRRDGGTGGFAFIGDSTLPIYEDLNTEAGRKAWDLEPEDLAGASIVSLRAREGEEASCLNLNRAQTPRVLGVNVNDLASRGAFPFAAKVSGLPAPDSPWQMLQADAASMTSADASGAIPAIMDQYSAMFALGKNVGDLVTVPNHRGDPVQLKLVGLLGGTVLQGSVLVSEENFVRLYPDSGGFRQYLVDCAPERAAAVSSILTKQLGDRGLSLVPAAERLAQFQAVQNTYLDIFTVLGGMALILAAIGLAVMVARHVLERRGEFGLLQALGFRPAQLQGMVIAEHWFLFLSAVGLGIAAAAVAVWPNLRLAGAGGIPLGTITIILAALLAGGLLFCAVAARLALGTRLSESLRAE